MRDSGYINSVLLLTPDITDNSTGRTFALWLLARSLGYRVRVLSFKGNSVWGPLENTEFAADCTVANLKTRRARAELLADEARNFDVVIAVKPLPNSLGIALRARKIQPFPLVLDIDDPDLELRLSWRPIWRGIAWRLYNYRFWVQACLLKGLSKHCSIMVSNPVLNERYGGLVVPHVRGDVGLGARHTSRQPVVAFVGTPRAHKGIDTLRAAVEGLASKGFRLIVTASAPVDAKSWEDWVGPVPLEKGLQITAEADLVVLPSEDNLNARGQLPVKLIDAMLLGRAVITSNIEPMPWATGGIAPVITAGDVDALRRELLNFIDPSQRSLCGERLRRRALAMFTVEGNAKNFEAACLASLQQRAASEF